MNLDLTQLFAAGNLEKRWFFKARWPFIERREVATLTFPTQGNALTPVVGDARPMTIRVKEFRTIQVGTKVYQEIE